MKCRSVERSFDVSARIFFGQHFGTIFVDPIFSFGVIVVEVMHANFRLEWASSFVDRGRGPLNRAAREHAEPTKSLLDTSACIDRKIRRYLQYPGWYCPIIVSIVLMIYDVRVYVQAQFQDENVSARGKIIGFKGKTNLVHVGSARMISIFVKI